MSDWPHLEALRILAIGPKPMEDLLLWDRLGKALQATVSVPTVVLHGAGEMAARVAEGDGHLADLTSAPALVLEKAIRTENKRIAGQLTQNGVPAAPFMGSDRRMIRRDEMGVLQFRVALTLQAAARRTVPVVSTIAASEKGLFLPSLPEALESFCGAAEGVRITVNWLVDRGFPQKPSVEMVRQATGEQVTPILAQTGSVSVRVLGISEVASGSPHSGYSVDETEY